MAEVSQDSTTAHSFPCPMCGSEVDRELYQCHECGEILNPKAAPVEEHVIPPHLVRLMNRLEFNLFLQICLWPVTFFIPWVLLAIEFPQFNSGPSWLVLVILGYLIVFGLGTRRVEAINLSAVMQLPIAICFLTVLGVVSQSPIGNSLTVSSAVLFLGGVTLMFFLFILAMKGFNLANEISAAGYDVRTFAPKDPSTKVLKPQTPSKKT